MSMTARPKKLRENRIGRLKKESPRSMIANEKYDEYRRFSGLSAQWRSAQVTS